MVQYKRATEEAYIKHHNSMMWVAITIIVVATILYYLLAKKHLIKQGSLYENLFSVSLIIILSLFFLGICF